MKHTMPIGLAVASIGATVAAGWYFSRGTSEGTSVFSSNRAPSASKADQDANESLILSMFQAAGFSPKVAKAAVINAMAESDLDNLARGDGGHAVGLFQIHDLSGKRNLAGVDRENPVHNTRWIIENEATKVKAKLEGAKDIAEAADLFARLIERPAKPDVDGPRRSAMAVQKYGAGQVA